MFYSQKQLLYSDSIALSVCVYIPLFEQQRKYGDALEILPGKLGSLMMVEADKLWLQVLRRIFLSYSNVTAPLPLPPPPFSMAAET